MPDPQDTIRFEKLVLPRLDSAANLARWILRNRADVDDVVPEETLRAYRFFGQFRGGDARRWLLQMVRNTCYTSLQKEFARNGTGRSGYPQRGKKCGNGSSAVRRGRDSVGAGLPDSLLTVRNTKREVEHDQMSCDMRRIVQLRIIDIARTDFLQAEGLRIIESATRSQASRKK